MKNYSDSISWILFLLLFLILAQIFIPFIKNFFEGSFLFLTSFIAFSFLGGILVIFSLKEKAGKFLFLAGISALFLFPAVLFHNFFYGLAVIGENIFLLKFLAKILDVFFFFVAVFGCPLLFLVSSVGRMYCLIKGRQ